MQFRNTTLTLLCRLASPAFHSLTTVSKGVSISQLLFSPSRRIRHISIRSSSSQHGARVFRIHQLILESEERAKSAAAEPPPPKLSLEHVNMSFARSGGSGGQNVNKVNTKVDMRFNVKKATWLSERIRDKILVLEKNRINKEGEIVISSTRTRTQQGNIEDCLQKLQAIIDAAAYVPPPPSEEIKKRIGELAAKSEQKRVETKKALSQKKQFRRSKGSWD